MYNNINNNNNCTKDGNLEPNTYILNNTLVKNVTLFVNFQICSLWVKPDNLFAVIVIAKTVDKFTCKHQQHTEFSEKLLNISNNLHIFIQIYQSYKGYLLKKKGTTFQKPFTSNTVFMANATCKHDILVVFRRMFSIYIFT